tara:strand:+ start:88 stop:462 length:375 start_codon:yes stop_codon:yes gene_type:complete
MESAFENLSLQIILLVAVFRVAAFENQRWVRARRGGMTGASEIFGLFVDLTMGLGGLLWWLFLISFAVDTSFLSALFLYLITFGVTLLWSLISRDTIFIWFISTLLVLPVGLYLVFQTTLFGLL